MTVKDSLLYVATVIIWGSTWIGIKFQLGTVDPMISVVYRFALSSVILLVFCKLRGLTLVFSFRDHVFMGLLGLLLFSVNYWLVYVAEVHLTSGLVAVLFSSIVFMNIANGAFFLGTPVERKMVLGAMVGIMGIGLIFMHEIESFDLTDKNLMGVAFGFTSVLLASLGNITSARNSRNNIPVIQANAFGMGYGALALTVLALILGKEFDFSMSLPYVTSLLYLAVFGSIIAFTSYLTLIRSLGADKASYSIMVVPVVALLISSFVEGYVWSVSAITGLILVVGGNFLALHRPAAAA
jgi:drug/metabolite transporter (DMT)-like permease